MVRIQCPQCVGFRNRNLRAAPAYADNISNQQATNYGTGNVNNMSSSTVTWPYYGDNVSNQQATNYGTGNVNNMSNSTVTPPPPPRPILISPYWPY